MKNIFLKVWHFRRVLRSREQGKFFFLNFSEISQTSRIAILPLFLNIINEWYAKGYEQENPRCDEVKGRSGRTSLYQSTLWLHERPRQQKEMDCGRRSRRNSQTDICPLFGRLRTNTDCPYSERVITPTIHFQRTGRATRNTPPNNPL